MKNSSETLQQVGVNEKFYTISIKILLYKLFVCLLIQTYKPHFPGIGVWAAPWIALTDCFYWDTFY